MKNVFSGKRVFITGHTGFKGIWLSLVMKQFGAQVYGYALPPVQNPIFNEAAPTLFEKSWLEDIRDSQKLSAAVQEAMPDLIFHMAAQPLVIESYKDPVYTFDVNVIGTATLLEALRGYSRSCAVLVITTDKVYENLEWVYPYRESDALGGHDPYSASKACTELVVQSFRKSFFSPSKNGEHGIAIASVRAGNVIGGGDWAENRIIPDIVRAFHLSNVLQVRNPNSVRPWQHVLDALYGYLTLAAKMVTEPRNPIWQSSWNFGPSAADNLTVAQIVDIAMREWGGGEFQLAQVTQDTVHEAGVLRLDCSKSQQLLQWHPKWQSNDAIKNTIQWYKTVCEGKQQPVEVTLSQITSFFELN